MLSSLRIDDTFCRREPCWTYSRWNGQYHKWRTYAHPVSSHHRGCPPSPAAERCKRRLRATSMRRLLAAICHRRRRRAYCRPSTSLAGVRTVKTYGDVNVEADITTQYPSRLRSVRHSQSVPRSQRTPYDRIRLPRASAAPQPLAHDHLRTSRASETRPMPRRQAPSAAYGQEADRPPDFGKEE